jgi:hypothetical protein
MNKSKFTGYLIMFKGCPVALGILNQLQTLTLFCPMAFSYFNAQQTALF